MEYRVIPATTLLHPVECLVVDKCPVIYNPNEFWLHAYVEGNWSRLFKIFLCVILLIITVLLIAVLTLIIKYGSLCKTQTLENIKTADHGENRTPNANANMFHCTPLASTTESNSNAVQEDEIADTKCGEENISPECIPSDSAVDSDETVQSNTENVNAKTRFKEITSKTCDDINSDCGIDEHVQCDPENSIDTLPKEDIPRDENVQNGTEPALEFTPDDASVTHEHIPTDNINEYQTHGTGSSEQPIKDIPDEEKTLACDIDFKEMFAVVFCENGSDYDYDYAGDRHCPLLSQKTGSESSPIRDGLAPDLECSTCDGIHLETDLSLQSDEGYSSMGSDTSVSDSIGLEDPLNIAHDEVTHRGTQLPRAETSLVKNTNSFFITTKNGTDGEALNDLELITRRKQSDEVYGSMGYIPYPDETTLSDGTSAEEDQHFKFADAPQNIGQDGGLARTWTNLRSVTIPRQSSSLLLGNPGLVVVTVQWNLNVLDIILFLDVRSKGNAYPADLPSILGKCLYEVLNENQPLLIIRNCETKEAWKPMILSQSDVNLLNGCPQLKSLEYFGDDVISKHASTSWIDDTFLLTGAHEENNNDDVETDSPVDYCLNKDEGTLEYGTQKSPFLAITFYGSPECYQSSDYKEGVDTDQTNEDDSSTHPDAINITHTDSSDMHRENTVDDTETDASPNMPFEKGANVGVDSGTFERITECQPNRAVNGRTFIQIGDKNHMRLIISLHDEGYSSMSSLVSENDCSEYRGLDYNDPSDNNVESGGFMDIHSTKVVNDDPEHGYIVSTSELTRTNCAQGYDTTKTMQPSAENHDRADLSNNNCDEAVGVRGLSDTRGRHEQPTEFKLNDKNSLVENRRQLPEVPTLNTTFTRDQTEYVMVQCTECEKYTSLDKTNLTVHTIGTIHPHVSVANSLAYENGVLKNIIANNPVNPINNLVHAPKQRDDKDLHQCKTMSWIHLQLVNNCNDKSRTATHDKNNATMDLEKMNAHAPKYRWVVSERPAQIDKRAESARPVDAYRYARTNSCAQQTSDVSRIFAEKEVSTLKEQTISANNGLSESSTNHASHKIDGSVPTANKHGISTIPGGVYGPESSGLYSISGDVNSLLDLNMSEYKDTSMIKIITSTANKTDATVNGRLGDLCTNDVFTNVYDNKVVYSQKNNLGFKGYHDIFAYADDCLGLQVDINGPVPTASIYNITDIKRIFKRTVLSQLDLQSVPCLRVEARVNTHLHIPKQFNVKAFQVGVDNSISVDWL